MLSGKYSVGLVIGSSAIGLPSPIISYSGLGERVSVSLGVASTP